MSKNTTSALLDSLRSTSAAILANSNGVHQHGERYFLTITGTENIGGRTYLVGDEPFRDLVGIKIHVKDPALESVKRGDEVVELRKFSQLTETGAVQKGDVVVFKDVAVVPGTENLHVAHSYETPFNSVASEEAVKSTSVMTGYMSLEGKEYPKIVLYQTSPAMVGTLSDLARLPQDKSREYLMDGLFMANLQSEADLIQWAKTQFMLKRPVTVRAIVAGEDGVSESVGVKVNPKTVEQTNEVDKSVYRVNSVEASMDVFFNSKEVQQIIQLLRLAIEGNYKVDTFERGGQIMLEGIPTLRVNDAYRNVAKEYARNPKGIFERTAVAIPGANRTVMQDVALQGVLITKVAVIKGDTGNREVVRVGAGSGLFQHKTEAYMLAELPTPNFQPSNDMGVLRDHDHYIGANRAVVDDENFRNIVKEIANPGQVQNAKAHSTQDAKANVAASANGNAEAKVQTSTQVQTEKQVEPQVQNAPAHGNAEAKVKTSTQVQTPKQVEPQVQSAPVHVNASVDSQAQADLEMLQRQNQYVNEEFDDIDIQDDRVDEDDLQAALANLSMMPR